MKKKVKKIPKYNGGGTISPDVLNKSMEGRFNAPTQFGKQQPMTSMAQHSRATVGLSKDPSVASGGSGFGGWGGTIGAAATAGGKMLMDAFGVDDNSQAGVTLNSSMQGAEIGGAIVPGWGHLIGGVAGGAIGAFKKGSVDENTGEITSGGIFGHSMGYLRRKSNMIKNSIQSQQQTQNLQADYYNNPNVVVQPNVLAAEGGIMRQPVDALVSPGEIAINPYTLEYRQFGSDNEEPNSKDNIRTVLKTGDNVKSHAEHMIMPNGKTPADNSKMVLDSNMPEEMKRKMIKKIDNWESAHRTKPQEYAKFDEGTPKVRIRRKEPLQAVEWNGKTGYFTADGGFIELPPNPALWPDSVYLGRYDYVDKNKVQKSSNKGVHTSNELNFNTSRHTRDGVNDKVVSKANKARKTPTQEEINAFYGYDREKVVETERKDRSERINNKNRKYLVENENENEMAGTLAEVVVTAPRINKASSKKDGKKSSSGKKTDVPQSQGATPTEVNQIGLDWARQEAARTMSQYAPNTTRPIAPGLVTPKIDPTETVEEAALPGSGTKGPQGSTRTGLNGSNWRDGLYRMAVLSQPLWDRAEAEPVNYESPVYKYMPTQIDVSSQLRDTDQSYALARYNFANLYPNTGAGMAAGLQAAQNRAKQYADIRQWQTNAQNELIGKNVGIYNNWANEHARIMNEVYNKTAANRAAARNINRQNRAAALSNYGQMLRDDKQYAMDTLKINMLEPLLAYGTENSDTIVKKARNILSGNYGKPV